MPKRPTRPTVFLSFAGDDRPMAELLARDLGQHDINTFFDSRDIKYGHNVVLSINKAMTESNYYVLLWSRNCIDRRWVEEEWTAAYAREARECRSFLFIVTLDRTPLPTLLSARRYLDGFADWASVARELVSCWRSDLAAGVPSFPEPHSAPAAGARSVAVRVHNKAFGMIHVVSVRPDCTGDNLLDTVRTALALPDVDSQLGGALELRFSYTLRYKDKPLSSAPIAEQGITAETLIDLEVRIEGRGPDGPLGEKTFRASGPPGTDISEKSIRASTIKAFAHLLP